MKKLIALLAVALMLSGCAAFDSGSSSQRLVIQYATLKFIEQADNPVERADKVREVVADLKTFLSDNTAALDQLETMVMARADLKGLSPADRLLAQALIHNVVQDLTDRVGRGTLDADAAYQVNTVLNWVLAVL